MRSIAALALPIIVAFSSCGGSTTTSSTTTGGGSAGSHVGTGGTSGTTTGGGGSGVVPCGKSVCVGGQVCCNSSCGICTDPNSDCAAIACDDPPLDVDCNTIAKAPFVGSCMQILGAAADASVPGPQGEDLTVKGKVLSVQNGVPVGGCMQRVVQYEANPAALAMATVSLVVSDGSQSWDVEYLIPGGASLGLTGSDVEVTYHYRFGGFGPTERWLTLTTGGRPVVYQGDAGEVGKLVGAPVPLSRGSAICTTHDTCGDWARYDLTASSAATTTSIAHGGSAAAGAYLVVHGGYAEQTSPNTMCPDWFVADVHVGMVVLVK